MTCYRCGAEIDPMERAGKILVDKWLCEVCLEKAEKCVPREDYEGGNRHHAQDALETVGEY